MRRSNLLLLPVLLSLAFAQEAVGSYRIPEAVIAAGCGYSLGNYRLSGTIGQPAIGLLSGAPYRAEAGFWYALAPSPSDVAEDEAQLPQQFSMIGPAPNPSGGAPQFWLAIPRRSWVSLKLYDPSGRLVRTVLDGPMDPGIHRASLDSSGLASGIYFCRLEAQSFEKTRRLVLVR